MHDLTYEFPMLPLKAGLYTWMVSFWEQEQLIDMGDLEPEFQVVLPSFQHPRDEWSGVLNLPSEFTVHSRSTALASRPPP